MEQAMKNAKLSSQILNLICDEVSFEEAFDKVLGEGAFKNLSNEIYEQLRQSHYIK